MGYNINMPKTIPQDFKKYFWDTNFTTLDINKNETYIIERLLELGDINELSWLNDAYNKDKIVQTLQNSRRISPKTGNFYSLYYKIPKDTILCMKKRSI